MNSGSRVFQIGFALGVAAFTVVGLTSDLAAQTGPTFKCKSNQPAAERAICSNRSLWRYDRRMADTYFQLKSLLTNESKRELLSDQRDWLKQRGACKWDVGCLTQSYQTRISFLEEILAQGGVTNSSVRQREDTFNQDWQNDDQVTDAFETDKSIETIEVSYPAAGMSLGANLRSQPGKKNAKIGVLVKGDPLIILDQTDVLSGQYAWYHVMGPTGAKGYIWGGALCNFYDADDGVGCSQN